MTTDPLPPHRCDPIKQKGGTSQHVAPKRWSVQPQDLLFTHIFCDHVPNFRNQGSDSFLNKNKQRS